MEYIAYVCVSGVRNVSFSKRFACVQNTCFSTPTLKYLLPGPLKYKGLDNAISHINETQNLTTHYPYAHVSLERVVHKEVFKIFNT